MSKYLTLNLTNTVTYYRVETAFDTYEVGDRLTLEEYQALTDAEKENCYSANRYCIISAKRNLFGYDQYKLFT